MNSLFNYETLNVRLESSTRTLVITLNDRESFNDFSMKMLFEMESALSWVTSKVEVHSVLINSSTEFFSKGLSSNLAKSMNRESLEKFFTKLRKINHALFHLPQTVVVDLGDGSEGVASELAIGADIRVCSIHAQINFNQTNKGLIPCSGGLGFLSTIITPAMAKNWILTSKNISKKQLSQSGFIHEMYDSTNNHECVQKILQAIREQAPIQRIQAKLGLLEGIRARLEHACTYERQIAKASLISEDWKSYNSEKDEFMQAKGMGQVVKLTLVPNRDGADSSSLDSEKLPDNVTPIN